MRWYEFALMLMLLAGPPAAIPIVLGIVLRRWRTPPVRFCSWILVAIIAFACWFVFVPATRRTNDPGPEGILLGFLIRWGPLLAAAWLGLQEILAAREGRKRLEQVTQA